MPIAPWQADSLTHVRDAVSIQPIYAVELVPYFRFTGQNPRRVLPPASLVTVPAWNVEVSLDGGRAPYGTARFSAPVDYISADPITLVPTPPTGTYPTYAPLEALHPYRGAPILIKAGYQRGATANLHPLFVGYITARRLRRSATGETYVEFTCETSEAMFQQPFIRDGNVGNTWTSVKQACDTTDGYGNRWYRWVNVAEEAGQMNTPTSGQLTAWRGWAYNGGDDVLDTVIAWATALGQWLRGNPRELDSSWNRPQLLISANPDPYRAATTLPSAMFTDLERVESLDQWANILQLSTSWTDPSSKDTKQKQATYLGDGVYWGAPTPTGQMRTKNVSMRIYPPSGNLPASYPPATEWLKRIGPRQEAKWTGQSRAMYWLQPRIDGIVLSDNSLGDAAGPIDAITWRLDDGTQTMTWSADAVYKP